MAFFDDCKSIEELEARKKLWAKRLHPDAGGVHATFTSMMQEYEDRIRHTMEQASIAEVTATASTARSTISHTGSNVNIPSTSQPNIKDLLDAVHVGASILSELLTAAQQVSDAINTRHQRRPHEREPNRQRHRKTA